VKQASVKTNSTGNQVFARCVEQALARWKFAKPADGKPAQVSWRFQLTAGHKTP